MRVLVCGGRDYSDFDRVKAVLDEYAARAGMLRTVLTIIEGGASGADRLAALWCDMNPSNLHHITEPADWSAHSKAAGPIRNQKMIDEHNPHLVLAFPGGKGTADMVRRARAAGIEVREIGASE